MRKRFQIGKFRFELSLPDEIEIPFNMLKFMLEEDSDKSESCEMDMFYELEFKDEIESYISDLKAMKDNQKEVMRSDFQMFYVNQLECRLIGIKGCPDFYAVSLQKEDRKLAVTIHSSYKEWMSHDTIFASLLMLEKFMLEKDSLILHSSYTCTDGKALLFSAPSETGKSTQSALWEQYKGARTINGDRSLLYQKEGQWVADGWPVCGDSGICKKEAYPIQAVVMLRQAKENKAYRLKPMQAFQEIFSQITVNGWNREFQGKVMDLLERLIQDVPVYCLECNISKEAVECLYQTLNEDEKN